ncbi:MAG: hypothetical protein QW728_05770 [Thermoplasmata archaeon]
MDTVFHIIIPLLAALAVLKGPKDRRTAILLSPLAVLPDIDAFAGPHRVWAHNFLVVTVMPLSFILFAYLRKKEWLKGGFLALFYLTTHILFDIDSGIAYFWPLIDGAFLIQIPVQAEFEGSIPSIKFPCRFEYIESGPPPLTEAYIMSPWAAMLAVGIITWLIIQITIRGWKGAIAYIGVGKGD